MQRKGPEMKKRIYLIASFILLVGFSASLIIYLTADHNPDNALGLEDSKIYRHDLEVFGGKANLLINDFRTWYAGLWHGESLAFTIAFITFFISLVLFLIAGHMDPGSKNVYQDRNNQR